MSLARIDLPAPPYKDNPAWYQVNGLILLWFMVFPLMICGVHIVLSVAIEPQSSDFIALALLALGLCAVTSICVLRYYRSLIKCYELYIQERDQLRQRAALEFQAIRHAVLHHEFVYSTSGITVVAWIELDREVVAVSYPLGMISWFSSDSASDYIQFPAASYTDHGQIESGHVVKFFSNTYTRLAIPGEVS